MKILLSILFASSSASAAIWGTNDIRTIPQSSAREQKASESVAQLIPKNLVTTNPDGTKNIDTQALGENWYLCDKEPWAKSQSVFVGCTGFLISPTEMLTAGHCMVNFGKAVQEKTPFCADFIWVFGFQENAQGKIQTKNIPADRFAECENVIEAVHDSEPNMTTGTVLFKDDYALTTLKVPSTRTPLKLAMTDPSQTSTPISMIGHPLGGPMKSSRGKILSNSPTFWSTNLDSFPGNSGSPVFNSAMEVIGILVRGYPESVYEPSGQSCNRINWCTETGSQCNKNDSVFAHGEHVQKLPRKLLEKR